MGGNLQRSTQSAMDNFSDYIVYVDESGDHGLQSLDPHYPVFVLAFCIFHKCYYSETVVSELQKFKFRHFGHDLVILHEHEIRKENGDFTFFRNREHKQAFLDELTGIINTSQFILVSCVIEKARLTPQQAESENPYHLALGFCLESLYEFLAEERQEDRVTHVVVERRGRREDDELELEFRRLCDGHNRLNKAFNFDIRFADKKANSAGLQLADLVARPIGLHILRPEQNNRAFETLKQKFYCQGGRQNAGVGYEQWGLKRFPQKSEEPR
ncbi:DUF3800 domain-containing protein [Ectothiorhodospira haloalkaliphila]